MARVNTADGGEEWTALTVTKPHTITLGTCADCFRPNQVLANNRCEDCRFYDAPKAQPGKRHKPSRFVYVRRRGSKRPTRKDRKHG